MTDREFVESHWEKVNSSLDFFGFSVSLSDSPLMVFAGWEEAAEFTRNRLEEIRILEEGIKWITKKIPHQWTRAQLLQEEDSALDSIRSDIRDGCKPVRIVSILQRELATLRTGMKETA